MAGSDINADESVSDNNECPVRESSSQSSTKTVLNTPELSTSTDQERFYPERERHPTQRLIENT